MLDILNELISKKSISPQDAGCLVYLKEILEAKGFKCYLKEFGEGIKKTTNLYAVHGTSGKNLCFAGHIDVVPAGDEKLWTSPPFSMTTKNNKIYGRGVVDMKGAVSCMVNAAIDYAKNNDGCISLLLTSDEEASGEFGTKMMLEWLKLEKIKIDFAIIGEPTSDKKMGDTIKIGRRGSINFNLIIKGKQGHVAYPELAINPNKIIVKVLNALQEYKIDLGNEIFQPSNLEITSIDVANNATNVIPHTATAKFNIRFNNIKTNEQIISEVRAIIGNYSKDYDLHPTTSAYAFSIAINEFTKEFHKIVERICEVKSEFSTSGGTSDARYIKDMCPLLEFGVLNQTAHHVDEYTEISHLQKLYSVYYESMKSYHKPLSI